CQPRRGGRMTAAICRPVGANVATRLYRGFTPACGLFPLWGFGGAIAVIHKNLRGFGGAIADIHKSYRISFFQQIISM
ncbi:MAG: hypothetical protein IJQ44_02685, partial [Bacteroidaceae bacterium]|nr:hypothetical protein [Bacteroidaceae bacterium]